MATLRWYLRDGKVLDGYGWYELTLTAQTAATLANGWVVGTGSTFSSEWWSGAGDRASTTFVADTVPDGTLDTGLKDAFRTSPITGAFASGNWTARFSVVGTVQSGAADGQVVFRVIQANYDGSSATEITSGQQSASVCSNVGSSDVNGTLTFSLPAMSFTGQCLFVQLAWKRTGAGGMTTSNIRMRTGVSTTVGTSILSTDFTPGDQSVTTTTIPVGSKLSWWVNETALLTQATNTSFTELRWPGLNIGQTISGVSGLLTSVEVVLVQLVGSTASDSIYIEVHSDTVTGPLLATSQVRKVEDLSRGSTRAERFSIPSVALSAGTTYCIEIFLTRTVEDAANFVGINVNTTGNPYAGGTLIDRGGGVGNNPLWDLQFTLYTGTGFLVVTTSGGPLVRSVFDTVAVTEFRKAVGLPLAVRVSDTLAVADSATPGVAHRVGGAFIEPTLSDYSWPTWDGLVDLSGLEDDVGTYLAQEFTVGSAEALASIELRMQGDGAPADNIYVEIRAGGRDGTVIGTSSPVAGSGVPLYPAAPAFITLSFPVPVALVPGTLYAWVAKRDGPGSWDDLYYVTLGDEVIDHEHWAAWWDGWSASAWEEFPGEGFDYRLHYANTIYAPTVALVSGASDQAVFGATITGADGDVLLEDSFGVLLEDSTALLLETRTGLAQVFAPAVVGQVARTAADTVTVTEFRKVVLPQLNRAVAETVTTQDRFTLTYVVDRPVRVQDVPAVALTTATSTVRTVLVADTISVLDVRRVGMPVTARLAETLTVAEFRKAVLPALVVRVAETVTATEFVKSGLPQIAVDVFDAVLVTDFRKALLPKLTAHPVEAVTVAEFRKALLPQLVARLAEVLTPADVVIALPRLARLNIAVAETVTAAESWKSPLAPYVARVQEVLTLVESIRALLPQIPVRPAETIAAIDVVLQQLRTARLKLLATEVVGVSEHVRAIVSKLLRAVAESLTVADVVLAEVSTNEMRVRLEEILNITEFVKAVLALLTVRAVDTLSVTELLKALLPQLALKRFETITVAEFLKAVVPLLVRPAEAISASDLLKTVLTPTALRLAETITVSEFVKAAFPGAGSASFDTLVVSDLLKAVLTPLVQRPSETLTVAELWKAVVTPLVQRPVENILVTEFRRAVLPLLATKRFDLITVADVAQQLLTLRRLHPAPSSELIAVAEFVALAMSGAGKPLELLTVLDVVRTVLTPGLQKVSDIITIAELARAVLTPFLSRRADTVTVSEFLKTVLTPFAVHPQDVVTVTDALLAFLQFVGTPVVQRVGIEAVTVAEFVKPVLPALFLRPADALTVGEVLRIALQPLIGDLSEVITVTEFSRVLLDLGDVDREVYDEVLVSEDVLTALTAIVHFVLVDLRAEDSQSRISGRLSGRVGSGSLRGLPLTGYLRSLAIPKAHRLYGSLRSPALSGFLRRLPVGVATRSTESAGVSDEARATLAVGPVTVRE